MSVRHRTTSHDKGWKLVRQVKTPLADLTISRTDFLGGHLLQVLDAVINLLPSRFVHANLASHLRGHVALSVDGLLDILLDLQRLRVGLLHEVPDGLLDDILNIPLLADADGVLR